MIIKKLNTMFHKHSRVLFGLFTVIIIVSFMGFLTPGQFGCDFDSGSQVVGEVYGKKVTRDDLKNFYHNHPLIWQKKGAAPRDVDVFYLYCRNFRADQLGIQVSDEEVAKVIRPNFVGKDGKYDNKSYRDFLDRNGITESQYVDSVRLELKLLKLEEDVLSRVVVTPSEVDSFYREQKTKLHFKVAAIQTAGFVPTENELQKFFNENKYNYRCAKFAVFPVFIGRHAAEQQAYDFIDKVKQNAADFDATAKEMHIEVLPEQWMPRVDNPVVKAIFAADAEHPVTEVIGGRESGVLYVGCLITKSDEEIKARLGEQWRLEAAMKKAAEESKRLNDIADRAQREKEFLALKNVKITDEVVGEGADVREGETMAVGTGVYFLKKREMPTGAVPEKERAKYSEICQTEKEIAAWRSFEEELNANCKFFMKKQAEQ